MDRDLKIALSIAIIFIAVITIITIENDDLQINFLKSGTLLDQVSELPEPADSENPITPITNPRMKTNSEKILVTSYYNRGFEECLEPGARLNLDCEESGVYDSYQNEIVQTPINESRYIPIKITSANKTGTYRCSFELSCDQTIVASSTTALKITS